MTDRSNERLGMKDVLSIVVKRADGTIEIGNYIVPKITEELLEKIANQNP